jgi:hypothetical protein
MQGKPQLVAALTVAAGCVAVLAFSGRHPAAAMLLGKGTSTHEARSVLGRKKSAEPPPGRFTIGGSVGGLFPGASKQLVLHVANPQHFAIVVTRIQTTVESPSQSCSGSYFTVPAFAGQLRVPAEGHAEVTVTVTLSHAAPDACQGAVFPLRYSGSARKP